MSTTSPLISIGLPVYNGKRFVAQAIEALLAQTYTNFELIISDNGSTDGTPEILRQYAARDARIKLFLNAENRGGAWNFQEVFTRSSGKYFRWAAYDDLCLPNHLEACLAPLEEHPSVVLCYPRSIVIDEQGRAVRDHDDNLELRQASPIQRYMQFQDHYRHGAACNPIYGLIRSDVLRQTQVMGDYVSSDIVLIGELALRGEFYEVPQRLFLRRDHPQTVLRSYKTLSEIMAWYNPNRPLDEHPVLRLLYEHMRAVQRVPMPWHTRMSLFVLIGRWLGWQTQDYVARLVGFGTTPGMLSQ